MHQFTRVGHPVKLAVAPGHVSGGSGRQDGPVHGVKRLFELVGVEEVAVPAGDEIPEDGFRLLELRGDGRKGG